MYNYIWGKKIVVVKKTNIIRETYTHFENITSENKYIDEPKPVK